MKKKEKREDKSCLTSFLLSCGMLRENFQSFLLLLLAHFFGVVCYFPREDILVIRRRWRRRFLSIYRHIPVIDGPDYMRCSDVVLIEL